MGSPCASSEVIGLEDDDDVAVGFEALWSERPYEIVVAVLCSDIFALKSASGSIV